MQKGKLVNPLPNKTSMAMGPYIVVRPPYEVASNHVIKGTKVTKMRICVDLLSPDGKIIKGVACSILEPA
jgi:hypothetical protein